MHYVIGIFLLAWVVFVLANVAAYHTDKKYPYVMGVLSSITKTVTETYFAWQWIYEKGNVGELLALISLMGCLVAIEKSIYFCVMKKNYIEERFFWIMLLTDVVTIIISACFIFPLLLI